MRIGFVSDLHIDFNRRYDFVTVLTQLVHDMRLDQLVIMGDSANGLDRNLAFYEQLQNQLPVPFWTLIGNHDLYVSAPREKSITDIQRASRHAYRELDRLPTALTRHPIVTNHWMITGINGWYDYTFAKHYDERKLSRYTNNVIAKHVWPDQLYINGNQIDARRDRDWVTRQIFEWQHQINGMVFGSRKLLVASHMLPTKRLARQMPIPLYDRFLYQLGSERYRELFEDNHVTIALSGHSHMPMKLTNHGIYYQNLSLGYDFQWQNAADALGELKRVMFVLED
ncbi:phosphohydrolase [Lentilactobacillus parafarraginis]|uniref:Phosphohydrolase n=1 Tax=Lentilactobacillus parafarraginis TaxID=390842 RepID=A0A5R9D162_9LACO|nr:metallophosphoesterase [Lentilactobacillus parafarraginis]TLQ21208.1 phosphohydrolase [Lentilactobacillus parafarraginis]